ncbi:MAG: sugar ABC transporter permease [Firmicutes bacterium]|nr:sugar ABC transporter permease [Bacillota bacterium]
MKTRLDRGYYWFLIPGFLLFIIFVVLPFIANIYLSFTRWSGVGVPQFIGLKNYLRAIDDFNFWLSLKNNVVIILVLTTIPTVISLFLAVFLFQYVAVKVGKTTANIFKAGFYLPQIIPVAIIGVIWKWIFQPNWGALNVILEKIKLGNLAQNWLGDPNYALGAVLLVMVWFQIGYPLVIFISALQRIDPQIYESARVDGAKGLRMFFSITLPLISPEFYVVVLTTIIYSLKIFGPIFALTRGGPGNATTVASYFSYKNFFEFSNVGYGATMSTIISLIILLITVVYIKLQNFESTEGE